MLIFVVRMACARRVDSEEEGGSKVRVKAVELSTPVRGVLSIEPLM